LIEHSPTGIIYLDKKGNILEVNKKMLEILGSPGEEATKEIFQLAIDLGGCLSGEHGIGLAKSRFLPMGMDTDSREFLSIIKKAIDPHNILNPGKFA